MKERIKLLFVLPALMAASTAVFVVTVSFLLLTALSYLLGIAIAFWEFYFFLKHGHWAALSILDGLSWFGNTWAASQDQTNWVGLHGLLEALPASVTLIVFAFFSTLVFLKLFPRP